MQLGTKMKSELDRRDFNRVWSASTLSALTGGLSNALTAAADSIQQAMDLRQGGDAFEWFLLPMTHWQLGQKDAALQWYTQAQEATRIEIRWHYLYP
jgi:hypothetical protein